jgi:hypothetical protein
MLGMDPDGPGIGKLFIFGMAGKAEVVAMIGFGQLRSTGSAMGIVAVEAEDTAEEMAAFLKVEPLLVMGF